MHINVKAWLAFSNPEQFSFTFISPTAVPSVVSRAIRHSCPEHSPSNTYQLFAELSKEQFLLPLMTTEEVEGVTEVVTMATVLDLQGGGTGSTHVQAGTVSRRERPTVPDYKHSSGSKTSNDKICKRTDNIQVSSYLDRIRIYTSKARSIIHSHRYGITA